MHPAQRLCAPGTKPELTKIERLLVKAQKICPVSGKDLESMGGPVKAEIDKQTVFLCCRGCLKRKVDQEHWEQVGANLAEAQGRCPVMDKPLPEDPGSIVVKKRVVFVCCSPCTRKIKADPDKYIATVDKLLERISEKTSERASRHVPPEPHGSAGRAVGDSTAAGNPDRTASVIRSRVGA